MKRTLRHRRGPRIALPALLASAALALAGLSATPGTSAAQVAAPTVTAQPATGVGLDVNWTAVSGAAGYQLKATDNVTGQVVTASCFGCTHYVIRGGLQLLHFYTVTVTPVNVSGTPVGPAGSATSATYYDLPPPAVTNLSAVEIPGTQTLRVTWAYSTAGIGADHLQLELQSVGANGALSFVGGATLYRTVDPNEYLIPVLPGRWVIRAVPVNAAGGGPETLSAPVTVANSCNGADLCARISADGAKPVQLLGQGFQHGVPTTNTAAVSPLETKLWRIAGRAPDTAARPLGGARMQLLSDLWYQATGPYNNGFAQTPWSNWGVWRDFVRATVQQARSEGWSPDYWDVWNEPNGTCCPKFTAAGVASATPALWLQTYEEAWKAIKSADPSAKVVGPSTSLLQWTNELWPDPKPEIDLDRFLAYSTEKGLVWDAVTWHESYLQPGGGDMVYSITNVARHFERARAVIARHPGTVVNGRIIVDEYGASEVHLLAGWAVGYFRQFEEGGVLANRSCWNDFECGAGFDGLFTTSGQPTALYWAHRLYADLDGGTPMAVKSSVPWQFDGLANRDDAGQTVRALLGRHWFCNPSVNAWCAHDLGIGNATANVTLEWPYGTAPVTVTVTRLPAGLGALANPAPVSADTITPVNGAVTVAIPAVADGDALSVIATSAGATTTTAPPTSTTSTTTATTAPPSTTVAGKPPTLNAATVTAAQGPTNGTITLRWAAAQPNGAPVTGYTTACSAAGLPLRSLTTNGSTLTATLGGMVWWSLYRCTVSATNQFGTSAPVTATPSLLRPRF